MPDKKLIVIRADCIENLLNEKNYQDIGTHLAYLETVDMTVNYLQETAVAKTVYRVLKNCPSMLLKNKAKHLLSKWKILYKNHCCQPDVKPVLPADAENGSEHLQVGLEDKNSSEMLNQHEILDPANPTNHLPLDKLPEYTESNVERDIAVQPALLEPSNSFGETTVHDTTAMRSKCRQLIYGVLTDSSTNDEEVKKSNRIAEEIEQHIFALYHQNNRKYKNCIRSKVSNLKNPKNTHLKHNLFNETLSPKEFAEMSVMEMASDELKQLRASYTESSVKEHQLPQNISGVHTSKIKCRRCEKFDCTVTVIARGALFLPSWVRNTNPDEQMMTYVICNECGEQWYHSRWICF